MEEWCLHSHLTNPYRFFTWNFGAEGDKFGEGVCGGGVIQTRIERDLAR